MSFDDEIAAAVIDVATPVVEPLRAAGFRAFVVGGLVRDLHLGIVGSDRLEFGDVDITTDATPDKTKALVAGVADDLWTQGERFGTIGLRRKDDVTGQPVEFEITTHRAEIYDPTSRKPIVEFSTAIEADLSRRDFTVNAMAIEVPSGRLVDPFDGATDLAAGRLRTPGSPEASFDDDPLRMLRAARFHAGHELEPVPELVEAMTTLAPRLSIVSRERVRDELSKLLAVPRPGAGVLLLGGTGLLELMVPSYDQATSIDVAQLVDDVRTDPLLRRAAFHLVFAERHGLDALGAHLSKIRYSGREQRDTIALLRAILAPLRAGREMIGADDRGVREFHSAAGELADAATELLALERLAGLTAVRRLEARSEELGRSEDLDDFTPVLTGREVMEVLGEASGPMIGDALDHLRELRLAGGPIEADEARLRLLEWHEQRREGSR